MTSLNSDEMRAIDQTRTRLDQLTKSIGALKNDILRSPVMPPMYEYPHYPIGIWKAQLEYKLTIYS